MSDHTLRKYREKRHDCFCKRGQPDQCGHCMVCGGMVGDRSRVDLSRFDPHAFANAMPVREPKEGDDVILDGSYTWDEIRAALEASFNG